MKEKDVFEDRCSFHLSLRYELFYALQTLMQSESRIHQSWKTAALSQLPADFHRETKKMGGSSEIWPAIADTLPGDRPDLTLDEMARLLREQPLADFQKRVLLAMIHFEDIVSALIEGSTDLQTALGRVPKAKQEWLGFVGLYPYDAESPMVIAMEFLVQSPKKFKESAIEIMKIFWQSCFRETWERMKPQLQRSAEEKERLFRSCSLEEFAKQALLRVHIDEDKELIGAVRGGFRLRYRDTTACYFMPSAFNDRRYWTVLGHTEGENYVYFPYFDPSIVVDSPHEPAPSELVEPELDPALIFKALGDSTRYAIASMIARAPTHSVELAKRLSVSKPTISHHVNQLREAGLIAEEYRNGCVQISLRRDVIEKLSAVAVRKLFDKEGTFDLTTSRKKSNAD